MRQESQPYIRTPLRTARFCVIPAKRVTFPAQGQHHEQVCARTKQCARTIGHPYISNCSAGCTLSEQRSVTAATNARPTLQTTLLCIPRSRTSLAIAARRPLIRGGWSPASAARLQPGGQLLRRIQTSPWHCWALAPHCPLSRPSSNAHTSPPQLTRCWHFQNPHRKRYPDSCCR